MASLAANSRRRRSSRNSAACRQRCRMSSTSITRSGVSRGAVSCLAKLRFYSCVLAGSPICLLLGAPLADELERSPVGRRTQSHPKRDRTHVRTELALLRAQRSPAFDACFRYGWLHPLPCSPGGGQHRQGDVRPALLRQTFSESPRQPAGDALCSWPPDWSGHREMAGQWPSDPDCPVRLLVEVALREAGVGEPCGEPTVDARSNGFHSIVNERGPSDRVCVKDAEACVETDAG